jgi:hypothetical protein
MARIVPNPSRAGSPADLGAACAASAVQFITSLSTEDMRRATKSIPVKYTILAALTGLTFVLTICFHGAHWLVDSLGPNLCAGFLGSLITIYLIDRATSERDRRIGRVASVEAYTTIHAWLRDFTCLIKSAQQSRPNPSPRKLSDLLSLENLSALAWLNVNTPIPGAKVPWYLHLNIRIPRLREDLGQILAKHGPSLGPELIEAIEWFRNDTFLILLGSSPASLNGTDGLRAAFSSNFLRLLKDLEVLGGRQFEIPSEYLDDDETIPFGSARLEALPPFIEVRI